ncbi:DUF934 domain-containing protein [Polynucleobacter brandtiae]|uniref:Uncharacterized protein (DUF934 family) n=1 Tax=Polynucleobacter brandtiae TaxID=1938816 RepID=A0A2M8VXN2_9BURK|nr:DUF934 domain-containing protein [Polynucleobacter brandtiae]PJI82644.1 uncharacterized protein (DUF934 family) [Polynucleobacter brandtiae]
MMAQSKHILSFPKDGKPALIPNEWQICYAGAENEDLLHSDWGVHKVLLPFSWWQAHFNSGNTSSALVAKVKQGHIGVWFSAEEDILQHSALIETGKSLWPIVASHFPIFRDGRSFSTAALLRERFQWQGEVRAIGDVLIDQLIQGARVGFDAFDLRPDQSLDTALQQLNVFPVSMQNSWRNKRTLIEAHADRFLKS